MYTFLSSVETVSSPTSSYFNVVGQTITIIFVLIFTLAIIYLFAYFAKKMKFGNSAFNNKNINIIEYKNIGNNNNIVLAKVGEKYVLLGSSRDRVNFLCDIDKTDIDTELDKKETDVFDFRAMLNDKIKEIKKTDDKNGGN